MFDLCSRSARKLDIETSRHTLFLKNTLISGEVVQFSHGCIIDELFRH